ncbi:MAG: hypothetical protein ACXIUZ_05305 [Lysobacteraceae bacterium]
MPWLYLIIAAAGLLVAFTTTSMALALLGVLTTVAGALMWLLTMLSARMETSSRSEVQLLSPEELRRLGNRVAAKGAPVDAAGQPSAAAPGTDDTGPGPQQPPSAQAPQSRD